MNVGCAFCGGACGPCLAGLYDDRFGFPGHFDLLECGDCGHRQLDARFSEIELGALYSEYYPSRASPAGEFTPYQETGGLAAWLDGERGSAFRWVPPNVRVIDIGSGAGRALAYHRARGCDAWGVEADEGARKIAEQHGLNVRIGIFDAAMFEPASFDYVTLDQVIEHATDPIGLARGAASLLRPGGRMILATPNSRGLSARACGRRWMNWHVPYHLHQFSRNSLEKMARAAGLAIESLRTLTNSVWMYYQWMHLATMPGPGQRSPFWDPARAAGEVSPSAWRWGGLGQKLHLHQIAARAADACGAGDSFLCILRKAA